jgi:citrate/tricarballylate utilization protein
MATTEIPLRLEGIPDNAIWQLEVCNACRYCEGYCAVFPALERRRLFNRADLDYLANLCFDCRHCYYACMFSPPHEYAVNLPQMLSAVRRETYSKYALPAMFTKLVATNGRLLGLIAAAIALLFVLAIAATGNPARLLTAQQGSGAFYRIIPYTVMFLPALIISVVGGAVTVAGGINFWRQTRGSLRDFLDPAAILTAAGDALGLRYQMGGGAGGCPYPKEHVSLARWVLHHLTFWGFLSAFLATCIAYVYEHFLGTLAPFPLLSPPVIFGTLGGVAMLVGTGGLIYLKQRSDRTPADGKSIEMDYVFLVLLCLVNVTGLALLVLRTTPAMGSLLVIHLATVLTLYVAMPYSKFVHFVYRYAALVQDRLEARRGLLPR